MSIQVVLTYSVIHFVMDFACMALVTALAVQHHVSLFVPVISYNFFAFFMQMPLGVIVDKLNKNALVSALGCVLVAGAFALQSWPFKACVVAGLGNALFHLGGGIDVLHVSGKRAAQIGIFVSTGALGLFFGKSMAHVLPAVAVLLLLATGLLVCLYGRTRGQLNNLPMTFPVVTPGKFLVALGLILTVVLRSYVGCAAVFAWKSCYWLALSAVAAVMLGKMLGGIIGDRAGFMRTAAVSLTIAAGAFLGAFKSPLAGCVALVCFNMTMPLTLTALANLMPHHKGYAFGLLTAALFVGGLPAFWGVCFLATPVGLSLLSVLSAAVLIPALYQGEKYAN